MTKVSDGKKIDESFNRLSRAHERYRRQATDRRQSTDGTAIAYSERSRSLKMEAGLNGVCIREMVTK